MLGAPVGLLLVLALAAAEKPPEDLAARIREGDREAFRTFFDRHHGRLLGYLRSRGLSQSEAEDVVQNAFLYIWEHRREIDPDKSLRAYLFRIGYTRGLNRLRDASKFDPDAEVAEQSDRGDRSSRPETPEADVLTAELRAQIDDAIAALPEKRRAVFELCFLRDYTYREAAQALDISPKTVETHIRLALRDLRETLAEHE
jgi:RNA polymerase sigma-70 factor (ECF subfamily)